jgi:tetratricopeptide (TPR) repeat protein
MYLPSIGLILIVCELARPLSVSVLRSIAAVVLLSLSLTCYERNRAWGDPSRLFIDAAEKSDYNPRPYLNLTQVLVQQERCDAPIPYLKRADQLFPRNAAVQVAWSWALECLGRREEALQRLLAARRLQPSSRTSEQIGLLYGEMGRVLEAGDALREAVALDPHSVTAHSALAFWHESVGELPEAEAEYFKAFEMEPYDKNTEAALIRVRLARKRGSMP